MLFSRVRFLLAFFLMALVAFFQREHLWITRRQHLQISLVSLLMVGIPSSIFFASVPYAPAGVLALWSIAQKVTRTARFYAMLVSKQRCFHTAFQ